MSGRARGAGGVPSRRQILEVFEAEFAKALKGFERDHAVALGTETFGQLEGCEATAAGESSAEKPAMQKRRQCVQRIRRVLSKSQRFYLRKVELYKWTQAGLDHNVDIERIQLEIESERQRIRQLLDKTAPGSRGVDRSQKAADLEFLDGDELDQHFRTKEEQRRLQKEIGQLLVEYGEVQGLIAEATRQHEEKVDELRKQVAIGFGNDCHQLETGADTADGSAQKIWALERQLIRTTQDYLGLRYNTSILERNLREEVAEAQMAEEALREVAHDCAVQVKEEIEETHRRTRDSVESSTQRMRDAVCAKRMERVQLLEAQEKATPIYAKKMRIAEKEARHLRRKLRRERGRYRMDIEGYGRDIDNLRTELQQLVRLLAMEEATIPVRRGILEDSRA